ncbi:MAG: carboxypeptidase regulatory-like domain-containing protein, partial [Acidimicrobiales bacterium]
MNVWALRSLATLAMAAGVAGPARAQTGGTIRGLAFDSLLNAGLPGAWVWVRGTGRAATTDSAGRFRIDSVPPGRHVLVLAHAELDSIGVHDVATAVTVEALDPAEVTLAVPSLATLWRRGCGTPLAMRVDSGVVFGIVEDVESGARLAGAGVLLSWLGLGRVGRTQVVVEDRELLVHTDSAGAYFACGAGVGTPVRVRAYTDADSTGAVEVQVGSRAVARRDLTIARRGASDSGARRPAALRGAVRG